MRTGKPIFATIFTVLGILVLLKLGYWQVERLAWKNDLLRSIDQEYTKDLMQHPISVDKLREYAALPATAAKIYRGQISGKLMTDKTPQFLITGPHEGLSAYAVFLPLEISDDLIVPVDIGWVAYNTKDEVREKIAALTPQALTLNVMLRALPKKNAELPEQYLAEWGYDVGKMQSAVSKVSPVFNETAPPRAYRALIKADAHPFLEGVTNGLSVKPTLRNKHKYYATFWLTMAFVLAVFYIMRFASEWRPKNS